MRSPPSLAISILTALKTLPATSSSCLRCALQLHTLSLKTSLLFHLPLVSSLLHVYSLLSLPLALRLFHLSPLKPPLFFSSLLSSPFFPASSTFLLHSLAILAGLHSHPFVVTNLLHSYTKSPSLIPLARKLFDSMPYRSLVTWNAMLTGYAKTSMVSDAIDLFSLFPSKDFISWSIIVNMWLSVGRLDLALYCFNTMRRECCEVPINEVVMVDLLSSCARWAAMPEGQQVHATIAKVGLDAHAFVQATVVHFYGTVGMMESALLQFKLADKSHMTTWSAFMAGLLRNGHFTESARFFQRIPDKDVGAWTTLMSGYLHHNRSDLALRLFHQMLDAGVEPNEVTLVTALSAVADSGTLEQGRRIHDIITTKQFCLDETLAAGLIDMYAKRGSVASAVEVFNSHVRGKIFAASPWNSMICALAVHGHARESLAVFAEMMATSVPSNAITFLGVLTACCHAGLLDEGRRCFQMMTKEHRLEPTAKHYGCMVDLLGRAGCLEEAEQMIAEMPMAPDVMIWGSMLAAARVHGNMLVGERAARELARLEPAHGAARILMSNIYADAGRWREVSSVRTKLQSGKYARNSGSSEIEQ